MEPLKIYQVDAFTNKLFSGNPAAVCILDKWLESDLMQSIGNENNLSETAFVVPKGNEFHIRWFTPVTEVDLCGHATLAAGFVLFNLLGYQGSIIRFYSQKSGYLLLQKRGEQLVLDLPSDGLELNHEMKPVIESGIGIKPVEVYKGKMDYLAVLANEHEVISLIPDLKAISKLDARGLIVTAKGNEVDFVSRFFAPQSGIDEDPVTGSAHASLTPFWSRKLGKNKLMARQLSSRGGELACEYNNDRCLIGGYAKLYLRGEIFLG